MGPLPLAHSKYPLSRVSTEIAELAPCSDPESAGPDRHTLTITSLEVAPTALTKITRPTQKIHAVVTYLQSAFVSPTVAKTSFKATRPQKLSPLVTTGLLGVNRHFQCNSTRSLISALAELL